MTCKNCGQEVPANAAFCANCGTKAEAVEVPPVAPVQPAIPSVPFENKPLSPWAYLGYQILFSLPVIGFIMLIILSTKAAHNVNLRNFARSYWCALLVCIILTAVLVIVALVLYFALGVTAESIINNVAVY